MRRGEEDDMSAFTVDFDNRAGELAGSVGERFNWIHTHPSPP
jgi:hypothetical protein